MHAMAGEILLREVFFLSQQKLGRNQGGASIKEAFDVCKIHVAHTGEPQHHRDHREAAAPQLKHAFVFQIEARVSKCSDVVEAAHIH